MASPTTLFYAGAAGIVGLVLLRYSDIAKGILTGDNALTKAAKNADGQAVTAYQGAGPVGTLGAAANAASGGYLSSFGQWLGVTAYDLFNGDQNAAPADQAPATHTKPAGQPMPYTLPVSKSATFEEQSRAGYDWRGYGWGAIEP